MDTVSTPTEAVKGDIPNSSNGVHATQPAPTTKPVARTRTRNKRPTAAKAAIPDKKKNKAYQQSC